MRRMRIATVLGYGAILGLPVMLDTPPGRTPAALSAAADRRMSSRAGTRLVALLSSLLVAVLWVAPQSVAYLCSMDGQRRAECCCAPDKEHAKQADSEVRRSRCCEVERGTASVSPGVSRVSRIVADHVASVRLETPPEVGDSLSQLGLVPALARGPPTFHGPPPFLRNCRFLI